AGFRPDYRRAIPRIKVLLGQGFKHCPAVFGALSHLDLDPAYAVSAVPALSLRLGMYRYGTYLS
ncbi:MAG: hypothetical protein WBY69_04030, partial [Candidatus Acidiferrales bacterium]